MAPFGGISMNLVGVGLFRCKAQNSLHMTIPVKSMLVPTVHLQTFDRLLGLKEQLHANFILKSKK